ncbi:MAG TPA: ABC transporter ATP-binding protein [Gemmatimonadaceae bacterium]|nr:ABC transporter ATP-binding protein [Gemmatimonadaceae bacterium]
MDEVLGRKYQESRTKAVSAGALALKGITRRFGDHTAVDNVSLEIGAGELLALIGASGSGKTTTLRIVAGYEIPDSGTVSLDGRDITPIPPQRRGFGMVFQHYALFPHMPVEENVAFGLEARGVPKAKRLERARAALESVGLGGAGRRGIQSLSGGEQQRVALARALVIEPQVLLLDEPLSNLDPTLRQTTRDELRAMLHRVGVSALFVTHDQEDAFAIADRIAVIRKGKLLQIGTPDDLYSRPASLGVAGFIGRSTILPAENVGSDRAAIVIGGVRKEFAVTRAPGSEAAREVKAVLRPDALDLVAPDTDGAWPGEVLTRRFAGGFAVYRVKLTGDVVMEVESSRMEVREGDRMSVIISREPVPTVEGSGA